MSLVPLILPTFSGLIVASWTKFGQHNLDDELTWTYSCMKFRKGGHARKVWIEVCMFVRNKGKWIGPLHFLRKGSKQARTSPRAGPTAFVRLCAIYFIFSLTIPLTLPTRLHAPTIQLSWLRARDLLTQFMLFKHNNWMVLPFPVMEIEKTGRSLMVPLPGSFSCVRPVPRLSCWHCVCYVWHCELSRYRALKRPALPQINFKFKTIHRRLCVMGDKMLIWNM